MLKRKLITAFAVLFMFLSGLSAVVPAYAASGNTGGSNFFSGLIQFIAQKFGLDQNTVKTAVTDYKNQQKPKIQQNMQNREKTRLDALVKQNIITGAQETAIIAELAALSSKYNPANFKNLTADQRKQQFQNEQNDIKSWAQTAGVDPKYVMSGFGRRGNKPSPTPTP